MELSLVIITLNEEKEIGRCISSVPFASEVVVVDSGSTDRTREIAERLGARVLNHQFTSYSAQKQWAVAQTVCDWILVLDADESLEPGLGEELERVLAGETEHTAFRLPFRMKYLGRLMRFGPWSGERHVRLFRRGCGLFDESTVHERILITTGSVGTLQGGSVIHRSYGSLDEQVRRMRSYAFAWAEMKASRGWVSGPLRCVLRPTSHYIKLTISIYNLISFLKQPFNLF